MFIYLFQMIITYNRAASFCSYLRHNGASILCELRSIAKTSDSPLVWQPIWSLRLITRNDESAGELQEKDHLRRVYKVKWTGDSSFALSRRWLFRVVSNLYHLFIQIKIQIFKYLYIVFSIPFICWLFIFLVMLTIAT